MIPRMSDIITLIDKRLAELGKSRRKASLEAGLGADAIRDLERKGGSPTLRTAVKLARVLGIPASRLAESDAFGRGEGAASGAGAAGGFKDEERPFAVATYDPDAPDPVAAFEPEAPDAADPEQPPSIPPNGVVEADTRFAMGAGGHANAATFVYNRNGDAVQSVDAIKPDAWIFPPWFLRAMGARPGDLMVAESIGDSMRPTIEPGMPLIIDLRHKVPSPDGIYAIRDRWGALQFKRLETSKILGDQTIRVISDNGGHVQVAQTEDDLNIVGRVVGGWKFF
jgi:transcriptional regulator with XRE-family HTH domain